MQVMSSTTKHNRTHVIDVLGLSPRMPTKVESGSVGGLFKAFLCLLQLASKLLSAAPDAIVCRVVWHKAHTLSLS